MRYTAPRPLISLLTQKPRFVTAALFQYLSQRICGILGHSAVFSETSHFLPASDASFFACTGKNSKFWTFAERLKDQSLDFHLKGALPCCRHHSAEFQKSIPAVRKRLAIVDRNVFVLSGLTHGLSYLLRPGPNKTN
jgi:hypothetical protein